MEFNISKAVEKIVMQVKENQEEFIFETIQPYCENILQMKINKEELKQILLNGIQKQQPIDKSAMMYEIYMEGVNMTGEYQGCWVRFKNIEKIVDKYMAESEVENE